MLTERNGIENAEPVQEGTSQASSLNEDPHSWAAIEKRLAKREEELRERDKQLESLSLGTSGTMDLTFDPPGGLLWLQNHPDS
jgi:hypothetical protein